MSFFRWATGLAIVALTLMMVVDELPTRAAFVATGLCEISETFSCSAVKSAGLSQIAGVPLSLFGLFFGLAYLFRLFNPSRPTIAFMKILTILNAVISIALLLYSVVLLQALCPFCFVYDVLGLIVLCLEWKNKSEFSWRLFSVWGLSAMLFALGWSAIPREVPSKEMGSIREQFLALPDVRQPDRRNGFLLHGDPSKKHAIVVSIFSDYECPHCKGLDRDMSELLKEFSDQIIVYEYFFPQNSSCNDYVRSLAHPLSCKAAMLAACADEDFSKLHHELFQQEKLTDLSLDKLATKYLLGECLEGKDGLSSVRTSIAEGKQVGIRMNPTIILNGKKIEGRPSKETLRRIFQTLISER